MYVQQQQLVILEASLMLLLLLLLLLLLVFSHYLSDEGVRGHTAAVYQVPVTTCLIDSSINNTCTRVVYCTGIAQISIFVCFISGQRTRPWSDMQQYHIPGVVVVVVLTLTL